MSGLSVLGASEVVEALVSGRVDWPGRGHTDLTWSAHPGWFVAALMGWSVVTAVLARVTMIGCKRFLWVVRR